MAGISRVHGSLIAPKNFAGVDIDDFTLTFWNGDVYKLSADIDLADGALDQIFRNATGRVATVSRVGTLTTGTGATANYVRFAIEHLGVDVNSPGYLGTGPDNAGQGDAGATTALALQEAVRALGNVTNSAGATVYLTSATVTAFTY
jgi:hypothetical protein